MSLAFLWNDFLQHHVPLPFVIAFVSYIGSILLASSPWVLWCFYGIFLKNMDILCNFYCVSMIFYGVSKGASMVVLWDSYGVSKGCLWNFHWIPVGFLWYFYDSFMVFFWHSYGIIMGCLMELYGIVIGFLSGSYAISILYL